jgi:hypothetical protein
MIPRKAQKSFFPIMKWSNDFLLGLRDVTGGTYGKKGRERSKRAVEARSAMIAMKRTRKRLARFLPRHGRLMVRSSAIG